MSIHRAIKTLVLFNLLLCPGVASAFELLGLDVATVSKQEFQQAIKATGAKLVSEAGDGQFYDSYSSENLLPGSRLLHLGFLKQNGRFAFAEYEFIGTQQPVMLHNLVRKYGPYQQQKGLFLTDKEYRWTHQGIQISLKSDWKHQRTRLIYAQPEVLKSLQQAHRQFQQQRLPTFNLNAY